MRASIRLVRWRWLVLVTMFAMVAAACQSGGEVTTTTAAGGEEATTTDPAEVGPSHAHRERGGYRCVDGVAAGAQHIDLARALRAFAVFVVMAYVEWELALATAAACGHGAA